MDLEPGELEPGEIGPDQMEAGVRGDMGACTLTLSSLCVHGLQLDRHARQDERQCSTPYAMVRT